MLTPMTSLFAPPTKWQISPRPQICVCVCEIFTYNCCVLAATRLLELIADILDHDCGVSEASKKRLSALLRRQYTPILFLTEAAAQQRLKECGTFFT